MSPKSLLECFLIISWGVTMATYIYSFFFYIIIWKLFFFYFLFLRCWWWWSLYITEKRDRYLIQKSILCNVFFFVCGGDEWKWTIWELFKNKFHFFLLLLLVVLETRLNKCKVFEWDQVKWIDERMADLIFLSHF